jgi:hypothetical protein
MVYALEAPESEEGAHQLLDPKNSEARAQVSDDGSFQLQLEVRSNASPGPEHLYVVVFNDKIHAATSLQEMEKQGAAVAPPITISVENQHQAGTPPR